MKTNFLKMLITGIDNEDDFREIQEKLFKYGHKWGGSGKDFIDYCGYKYVVVKEDGKMWTAISDSYKDYRKVTVERFLDKDFIGQIGEIKLDDEYIESLTKQYHEEYLNNNKGMPVPSQDLQDTPIKSMNTNGILSFVKNTFLTSDEREMKKAGLFDENLLYTTEALMIVRDLKAKSLGYKNFEEVANKTNQASLSTFELEELYSEFHEELVRYATEYNKSQEKKKK